MHPRYELLVYQLISLASSELKNKIPSILALINSEFEFIGIRKVYQADSFQTKVGIDVSELGFEGI